MQFRKLPGGLVAVELKVVELELFGGRQHFGGRGIDKNTHAGQSLRHSSGDGRGLVWHKIPLALRIEVESNGVRSRRRYVGEVVGATDAADFYSEHGIG
jgi:hypothetical protein